MTPIHTHDCDHCVLLGTAKGCDIYVHPCRDGNDVVIIRTGSDGPDYESCKVSQLRYRGVYHGGQLNVLWLYALGLYDGFERGREHEIAQQVAGILEGQQ